VPQAAKNKEPGLGGRVLALVSTKQSIAMSALGGHKRTFRVTRHVCFTPKSGHWRCTNRFLL